MLTILLAAGCGRNTFKSIGSSATTSAAAAGTGPDVVLEVHRLRRLDQDLGHMGGMEGMEGTSPDGSLLANG